MNPAHEPSEALIRKQGRYLALRNGLALLILLGLVGILALQTFLAIQDNERIRQNESIQGRILEQAEVNEGIAQDAKRIGKRVEAISERQLSCTDPGGKCFQQSRERVAKLSASVGDVVITAAACAAGVPAALDQPTRVRLTRACVESSLRRAS